MGSALERAERFLGLSVLAAIVLAGVAVAMAARRYSERHFDMSAMLRCLGASQRELLALYLPQLAVVGVLASAARLPSRLGGPARLAVPARGSAAVAPSDTSGCGRCWRVFATGLIALAGFALPPVMRLKDVPAAAGVTARTDTDAEQRLAGLWRCHPVYRRTHVALYRQLATDTVRAGRWRCAAAGLLALLGFILLYAGRTLNTQVGVAWRFGVNNLWRRRRSSVSQILAFGLALMAMAVIALVRTDLLTTWQESAARGCTQPLRHQHSAPPGRQYCQIPGPAQPVCVATVPHGARPTDHHQQPGRAQRRVQGSAL